MYVFFFSEWLNYPFKMLSLFPNMLNHFLWTMASVPLCLRVLVNLQDIQHVVSCIISKQYSVEGKE